MVPQLYIQIDHNVHFLEPEAKKLAPDPLLGMRSGSLSGMGEPVGGRAALQTPSPNPVAGLGGICNEDIRVPDKMVGLSKFHYINCYEGFFFISYLS